MSFEPISTNSAEKRTTASVSCIHKDEPVLDHSDPIAIRFFEHGGGFLSRLRWKGILKRFMNAPNSETYRYRQFDDGESRIEQVTPEDQINRIERSDMYARVTTAGILYELSYAGLHDQEGTEFDLVINGIWKICNRRSFLYEYGLENLKLASSLEVPMLETTLAKCCKQAITDEMRTLTYEMLKNQDALSLQWWNKKLPQWIGMKWLNLEEIKSIRYESASADRKAEIDDRRKLLELEDTWAEEQLERDRAQKHEQAEHEEAVRNLEMALELSEKERRHRIEELNWNHEQQFLQQERESELSILEHEKQKAELLADIEDARNRKESAQEILQRAKEIEQQTEERLQAIEQAQKEQVEAALLSKEALQNEMDVSVRMSTSVAEVSTRTMSLLGKTSGPVYMAQAFREKAAAAPNAVMMKKVEIRTRDIGTKRVDTLAINSPLCFEFLTQRCGYATVLNIGTSGKIYLHSPNAYVGIEQGQVEANDRYQVPGAELLPVEKLHHNGLAYLEIGPPGWEELIVIISNQPLITETDLFRATDDNPFVVLSTERIEQLLNQLAMLSEDSWNTGTLSFLVE